MNKEERFAELWADYLEGVLNESDMAELQELMDSDKQLVEKAADSSRPTGCWGSTPKTLLRILSGHAGQTPPKP